MSSFSSMFLCMIGTVSIGIVGAMGISGAGILCISGTDVMGILGTLLSVILGGSLFSSIISDPFWKKERIKLQICKIFMNHKNYIQRCGNKSL